MMPPRCCLHLTLLAFISIGCSSADPHLRQLVQQLTSRLEQLETQQLQQSEQLRQLRGQLQSRRQLEKGVASLRHQLQQLSEHVMVRATVTESLTEMRAEIDSVGREIRLLKDTSTSSSTAVTAATSVDQTLVLWLKDMVNMLKTQVADLAENCNSSIVLQRQQAEEVRHSSLARDVRALEDSVQTLRARRDSDSGQLSQLRTDVAEVLAKSQQQGATYSHLLDEVDSLREELLYVPLREHSSTAAPLPEAAPTSSSRRHHRRRHHRRYPSSSALRHHSVRRALAELRSEQQHCRTDLERARENVTSLQRGESERRSRIEQMELKLEDLNRQQQELAWRVNVTSSRDGLGEVQASTRQLIREVEQLETTLDGRTGELSQQLARLDVAQSRLRTVLEQLGDEQKQLPALRDRMSEELAELSKRQDMDRTSLLALQGDMLQYALDRTSDGKLS